MRKFLLFLFFSMLTVGVAFSQVTTSSLTGVIKDAKGETLIGATIKATHQPSGTNYSTATNSDGRFTISNMRVGGPYLISISYIGYENQTIPNITLKLGEPFVLNLTLQQNGAQLGEVTINATNSNAILNGNRNGAITNIGRRQIQTLPSITRSLNDMIRLTPQATSTSQGSIGGGNYRQNYITVDGSDFNNTFGIGGNLPANGSPISLDAIEEISVNVTPFDVKQSGFIGSSINAVTRSGTNDFTGSAYTYFRSNKQQGWHVGPQDIKLQKLQQTTWGMRLGGPIVKDKLFFFVNAETYKNIAPGQQNLAATAATGPGSYGSASNIARPTVTELNDIRKYLKDNYGYETGDYQGYDFESTRTTFTGRLDWNINDHNKFNVRYSQVESKSPSFVSTSRSPLASYSSGVGRTDINALTFANSNYYQDANFYSLSAELNSDFNLFGAHVANTFRGTYTNQNDPRSSDSQVFPFVDILKDGSPFTSFGYEPFTYGNLRDVKTTSFVDYLTWTTGKHNWTAGIQADFSRTKNGFQRFATSYYTFNSWADFTSGANPRDFAITYSLLPNFQQAYPSFKFAQYSLYAQDEIIVSDKLRITPGIRFDLPTFPDVSEIKTLDLVNNLTFANGEKINTGNLPSSKVLFSPRIGFNYDVFGDRSLQVRGGTGVFTGRVPFVWIVAQSGDSGLLQVTRQFSGDKVPGPFNPDPNAYRPEQVPAAGTVVPTSISALAKDFKFPQSWKSTLAVDAKLPAGFVGSIEAIYNKDINIAKGRNPNLVTPQALNVAGYPDNRPIYPNGKPDKFINPLLDGVPVANGTASATEFNPVVLDNASKGYYWSVTAKLDKQFAKGLYASVAYTKSQAKNLFDGSGDQLLNTWSNTLIVNNSNDPELSYANYVVPNRVVASLSYRKEYLKNLGTTVTLFYEGSSYGRFSYTYGGDFNRDGQTNDLIYIPKDPSEITFSDFNYGSTANPKVYTAAQQSELFFRYVEQDKYLSAHKGEYAQRNAATFPWRNQVDLKFLQDIFVNLGGKRNTLQFSFDIFNLGNLLNKNWGTIKTTNATGLLVPTNSSALVPGGTVKPTFRLATDRGQPATSTFRDVVSTASTYYMQFGLRYIFN